MSTARMRRSKRSRGADLITQLRRGPLADRRTKAGKRRRDRQAFMDMAREHFELAAEADEPQRARELDDLRFYAGDQWPEDIKLARAGMNAANGLPPVPARPCLVINKVREPIQQILAQARDAELGIELTPADDFEELGVALDDTEIKLREGLIRRIQRESQAMNMRLWAAQRAAIAGRGFYGIMTRFAPGKTFEQSLYVTGWYNQSCVLLGYHEQPDGSDATEGWIGEWITIEEYRRRHPNADDQNVLHSVNEEDFIALGDEAPRWFRSDGDLQEVHVVDYFYTEYDDRELLQLTDGTVAWLDELLETPPPDRVLDRRTVREPSVKWCKLDGVNPEPLEETDWVTADIPIIKVLGEALQPYDDERREEGIVRGGRDANEGFNAMASTVVEKVALAPLPSVYLAAGQDEGFENEWKLRLTRNLPATHYNFKDLEGQPVGPPTSIQHDPGIQAAAMALQMFDEAVQTTTRRHDPSLGKTDPSMRSARMADALIHQSKEGTSGLLDNLKCSIRREAQLLNNALYPVYGRTPGRLAKIVNGQGDAEPVLIGQPYTTQNGRPQPVMVPHPTDPMQQMPAPMGHPAVPPHAQQYSLSEHANCNVNITITRNFDTRRQEFSQIMLGLIGADPQLMIPYGDIFFEAQDWPGHEALAERAKLLLPPPVQQMLAAKANGGQFDPKDQQIQQLHQQLQQAQQIIQGKQAEKQAEMQGKMQIVQVQEQAETQRAAMDREVKLAVAEITAQAKQALQDMALFYEERSRVGAQIHEQAMGGRDSAHNVHLANLEASAQGRDHAHALALANQQAIADAAQATLEHQHTLAQTAQQAALQPATSPQGDGGGDS